MNSIIRNFILFFGIVSLLSSCIIQNPQPEDCFIKEFTVANVSENRSYDIKIFDGTSDYYYMNRSLETGLTIEDVEAAILNKKVTLQRYKF